MGVSLKDCVLEFDDDPLPQDSRESSQEVVG
jgi:hypothetical protein